MTIVRISKGKTLVISLSNVPPPFGPRFAGRRHVRRHYRCISCTRWSKGTSKRGRVGEVEGDVRTRQREERNREKENQDPSPSATPVVVVRSFSLRNATRAYPMNPGRSRGATGVEDFKATETIVRRRSRARVYLERQPKGRKHSRTRTHPFDYLPTTRPCFSRFFSPFPKSLFLGGG